MSYNFVMQLVYSSGIFGFNHLVLVFNTMALLVVDVFSAKY